MGRQSEQLERETERIRNELAGSLSELRYRLTPGQIVDQLTDYARQGPAAEFVRNLAREIHENPAPVLMIMIGVAWLAIATSLSRRRRELGSNSEPQTAPVDEIGVHVATPVATRNMEETLDVVSQPMPKANIHRRETLRRVYPPDAFARDAAENAPATNELVLGVRILSAPDAAGDFEFERASRHVGEAASATFLAPYRRADRLIDAGRDSPTSQTARPDPQQGYENFLADIIAAAQRFGFEPEKSPSRNEPRLQGLRQ